MDSPLSGKFNNVWRGKKSNSLGYLENFLFIKEFRVLSENRISFFSNSQRYLENSTVLTNALSFYKRISWFIGEFVESRIVLRLCCKTPYLLFYGNNDH